MEDYYKVLGVSRTATEDELKRAYRKLAKRCHPDTHPGDKECEERFRLINEAYDTLGNAAKRRKYDSAYNPGSAEGRRGPGRQRGQARPDARPEVDFADIHKTFEQFFGFDPHSHEVVNEEKLDPGKKSNPLDTTAFFEKFMGVRK